MNGDFFFTSNTYIHIYYHNKTLDKQSKESSQTPQTQEEITVEISIEYFNLFNQCEWKEHRFSVYLCLTRCKMKCVAHIFVVINQHIMFTYFLCPELNKKCKSCYVSQIHPSSKLFRATATLKCAAFQHLFYFSLL